MANTYTQGIYVDNTFFDIPIVSLQRTADFLDKYAERTEEGDLKRELIGVYFNYSLSIGTVNDVALYKRFWDKMTEPTEFHDFKLPDSDGTYSFRGYISSISDTVQKICRDKTVYTGFTCKLTSKNAVTYIRSIYENRILL